MVVSRTVTDRLAVLPETGIWDDLSIARDFLISPFVQRLAFRSDELPDVHELAAIFERSARDRDLIPQLERLVIPSNPV